MDIGYENPDVLESKDIESLDLINERNLQALIDRQLPSLKGGQISDKPIVPKDAFAKIMQNMNIREERIFENSKHAEQSIEDKLSRIKKELDEVERRIQVAEKEEAYNAIKQMNTYAQTFKEMDNEKERLFSVLDGKGYFSQIQNITATPENVQSETGEQKEKSEIEHFDEIIGSYNFHKQISKNILENVMTKKGSKSEQILFEMVLSQEKPNFISTKRISDLERKVALLENKVGLWRNDKKNSTIGATLEVVNRKFEILNSQSLEEMGVKAKAFHTEIIQLLDNMKDIRGFDFNPEKINELYELSENALIYHPHLCKLVERLEALKYLHDNGANLKGNLANIEKQQKEINQMLRNNLKSQNSIKQLLSNNIKSIMQNVQTLDQKILKISK